MPPSGGRRTGAAAALFRRFPQWREPLKKLLECHQLLDAPALPAWPARAEALGNFVLLAEFDRSAQGRVYLAHQPTLGNRLVVLKTTPRTGRKHLTLARLQHPHHAVVCGPRPSRTQSANLVHAVSGRGIASAGSDEAASDADERAQGGTCWRHSIEPQSSMKKERVAMPRQAGNSSALSYVDAICWIGACLADALQYAHEPEADAYGFEAEQCAARG